MHLGSFRPTRSVTLGLCAAVLVMAGMARTGDARSISGQGVVSRPAARLPAMVCGKRAARAGMAGDVRREFTRVCMAGEKLVRKQRKR